jgi:hypothetical protein
MWQGAEAPVVTCNEAIVHSIGGVESSRLCLWRCFRGIRKRALWTVLLTKDILVAWNVFSGAPCVCDR